jgi:hypothetical protein
MTTQQNEQRSALERAFRGKPVAQLKELQQVLGTSGRTVLRALQRTGYLTSYSHAGKFYTLLHIPAFDERGLWFHGEARFSKHGTLRRTVVVLVTEAPAGHTHEELAIILGLKVHDTLLSLVETDEINRVRLDVAYLYVAADPTVASAQLSVRETMTPASAPTPPPKTETAAPAAGAPQQLDSARVVDVLVAVIHTPKDDARTIAARLRAAGLMVADEQVEAVFEQYGLPGKKTARSRSRRSRR